MRFLEATLQTPNETLAATVTILPSLATMSPAVQKAHKKRQAATQAGPTAKKLHLEKTSETKAKKRSRPITSSLPEDSADTSDDDETPEELLEEEAEHEDADVQMGDDQTVKNPNGKFGTCP